MGNFATERASGVTQLDRIFWNTHGSFKPRKLKLRKVGTTSV